MTFILGRDPVSKVRRPPPRMPWWIAILLAAICLVVGIALGGAALVKLILFDLLAGFALFGGLFLIVFALFLK